MFSEEHATPKSDSVDVIKLKNITHIFNEGQPNEYKLFENFNLTIPDIPNRGQLVSIMGASGCGKSQMLKVIAGLNKFQKGTVEIYGKEIGDNHSFPMVFQTYSNYEWYTVLENVMIPMLIRNVDKATAEQKALALLEEVGLKEHAYKYPAKLSGGQQQRVAIARALLNSPKIILADEPTGNLDKETSDMIMTILKDINKQGTAVIMITHNLNLITDYPGTAIYKCENGKILPLTTIIQ